MLLILFLEAPKALKIDWNNPIFSCIKAAVLEKLLQKKIFVFNSIETKLQIERSHPDKSYKTHTSLMYAWHEMKSHKAD